MLIELYKLPLIARKIIYWIMNLTYFLIPSKYYLANYPGGKIYLNLRESHMMRKRYLGIYEMKKMSLFEKLVKPNMTIIDVGVNKGYFSLLSAKLMENTGKVYAIEPDSENCSWIKKSVENNDYKNIEVFQLALSNKNDEMRLYKGAKSGRHSIKNDMGLGFQIVKTQRLDDFVKENNIKNVDLIKIDVEGAEVDVIEGSEKVMQQKNLNIIIDVHDINRKKLFNLLNKYDYKLYKYNHNTIEKIHEDDFLKSDISEIYAKK